MFFRVPFISGRVLPIPCAAFSIGRRRWPPRLPLTDRQGHHTTQTAVAEPDKQRRAGSVWIAQAGPDQ